MYTISDLNKVLHKYRGWNCTQNKMEKMADTVSLHLFNICYSTSQAGIYYYKENTFWFGRIKRKVRSSDFFFFCSFSKALSSWGKFMHCHLWAQCDIGSCFKLATMCKVHCHDRLTAQLSRKKLTNTKMGTCGSFRNTLFNKAYCELQTIAHFNMTQGK